MIKDCSGKIVPDYVRMTFLVAALLPVLLTWTAVMRNVKATSQENAMLTPLADERDKTGSTADAEQAVQRHVIRQPFGGTQDRTSTVERWAAVDESNDRPLVITAPEQMSAFSRTGHQAATAIRLVRHVASGNLELDEPRNDLEPLETRKVAAPDDDDDNDDGRTLSAQNYYDEIRPTRTQSIPEDRSNYVGPELATGVPGTGPDSSVFEQPALPTGAGEAGRASSRGRSLPLTAEPATAENATVTSDRANATVPAESIREQLASSARLSSDLFRPVPMDAVATGEPADRKHPNGDIQDIVNGFIKLLNGNVAVQVNTDLPLALSKNTAAPLVRTRINNRGPPRISDVPPLFFETAAASHQPSNAPAATPTAPDLQQSALKEGHPYPFDVPLSLPPQPPNVVRPFVSGIPIPQLIVPLVQQSNVTATGTAHPDSADRRTTASPPIATQPDRSGTTFVLISNVTSSPTTTSPSSSDRPSANKTSNEKSPTANKISNQPAGSKNKTPADKIPIAPDKPKWREEAASASASAPKPLSIDATKVEDSAPSNKSESPAHSKVDTHSSSKSPSANVSSLIAPTAATGFQSSLSSVTSQISLPAPGANVSNGEERDTRPTTGIGTAVVVLEPSTQEVPSHQDAHKVTAVPAGVSSTVKRRPPLPSSSLHHQQHHADGSGYFPRPGIVLDDLEYKPAAAGNSGHNRRPGPIHSTAGAGGIGIITAAVGQHNKDIFDVTVSAIQGPSSVDPNDTSSAKLGQPYIYPVDIDTGLLTNNGNNIEAAVITSADQAGQNFVSIDGKRTYLNLFETNNVATHAIASIQPTHVKNHGWQAGAHASTANSLPPTGGHGSAPSSASSAVNNNKPSGANNANNNGNIGSGKPASSLPSTSPAWRKPAHPAIRIDTCIVGDDSTCDAAQHEICRTEGGVSSCHCRPSYNRRKHREPCHRVVSLFLTLRVDRMYDQHLSWNEKYAEPDSSEYQQLEYEANKAIDSALSMTPFSDLFLGARVNNIYTSRNGNSSPPVFVNLTIQLSESAETLRAPVKQDLQKHLMGVIHRRSNNIGSSPLWVDSPNGAISQIHDVDECASADLNDCHSTAKCTNIFGSFYCVCPEGYRDPWAGNNQRSGRMCEKCDPSNCNHRGECSFQNGQPVCKCTGSYYGSQCEIDGEVLGVAIGSSVIAVLIIVTTLACLCAWSRRWNKEQKIGSPIFGYMPTGGSTVKTPVVGAPPYQVSLEDRLRWAQIADAMAHANHYGPEPVGTLRPSSSIFGYSLPHSNGPLIMPRLRAPSVHTLRTPESSTSEEEDRADLLGRQFQVPRPKSRSSVANQSGIYYDVDYESQQQSGEIFSTIKSGQPPCIPLNTYTMGSRSHYYRS